MLEIPGMEINTKIDEMIKSILESLKKLKTPANSEGNVLCQFWILDATNYVPSCISFLVSSVVPSPTWVHVPPRWPLKVAW